MLSQSQRTTILELHSKGKTKREIARLLELSRQSVRKVLRSNSVAVPRIPRQEKASAYRQQILELLPTSKNNLVRVHEQLTAAGFELSYLSGVDGVLPPGGHWPGAYQSVGPL